jgi:hypothetical protein
MGFKNNCYGTVWENSQTKNVIEFHEKYAEIYITTSRKNANAKNGYETDFSGRVRFVGTAFEKVKNISLKEKDRLHLLEVETTSKYDAQRQRTYTNFVCWDFEQVESKLNNKQVEVVGGYSKMEYMNEPTDLPF